MSYINFTLYCKPTYTEIVLFLINKRQKTTKRQRNGLLEQMFFLIIDYIYHIILKSGLNEIIDASKNNTPNLPE